MFFLIAPSYAIPYFSSVLHHLVQSLDLSSVLHHPPVMMVQLPFSFAALYKPGDCLIQAVVIRLCIPDILQYTTYYNW